MRIRSQNIHLGRCLAGFLVILLSTNLSLASPLPEETGTPELNNRTLTERAVPCPHGTLCGYNQQLCCPWGQGCYTNYQTQAECTPAPTAAPKPNGHWVYYTSTWVETDRITKTKVYSRFVSVTSAYIPQQTTQKVAICYNGERPCGNICCQHWQHCVVPGQCGGHRPTGVPFTPPVRPTSYVSITHTNVVGGSSTTTVGFQPAVTTGHHMGGGGVIVSEQSGGGGLSAGAIAGIVIGVILGIIFLILLCLLLCFKTAWDALLAFFGIGTGRKRRETVEYEHYSRHGSRSGRQWYGSGRPPSQGGPPPKKEKRKFGWATIIAGLGALWLALGFKRRVDRRRRDEKSDYTASSGYYSYDSSSDRRTRDTRRSSRR